ncbi:DUF1772 domain-containing protein [Oricola thermophila]|uniref:DUF1772 domain-containing protein n=1 Tax=Oricola thermophila TaxID=2742145 RepID=A0A6N1V8W9_9HYPH|nr:anthrone oxygenase family protein [Oricola thermophila]QKV17168.1 DUF1772 domain-containing protein [Oricola thermophila]
MFDQWLPWGLAGAAIASALVAGVFLAFSDFIMRSLGAARPAAGMEAMQEINRKVYRSGFIVLLIAMVPVSLAIVACTPVFAGAMAASWSIAGAVLYILGVFAVTAAGNVPMNKRLDVLDPADGDTRRYWRQYARRWTWLNHVRMAASAGSAICYLAAAMLAGQAA